jgi:hypothetical protein
VVMLMSLSNALKLIVLVSNELLKMLEERTKMALLGLMLMVVKTKHFMIYCVHLLKWNIFMKHHLNHVLYVKLQ